MSRYIDADKAKEELTGWETDPLDEEIEWTIDHIPTADVVPVKHGHWVIERGVSTPGGDPCYVCSECGGTPHLCGIESGNKIHPKYCQDCGAKMDGEEQEHE